MEKREDIERFRDVNQSVDLFADDSCSAAGDPGVNLNCFRAGEMKGSV